MENDITLIVAKRLRKLRKKYKYTQQELAEKAEVDYKHIQKLEGKNPPAIRIDTLKKLAKAFNISIKKFLV